MTWLKRAGALAVLGSGPLVIFTVLVMALGWDVIGIFLGSIAFGLGFCWACGWAAGVLEDWFE